MGELRVAFWNVEDLFEPTAGAGRGPRTVVELEAKIDRLVSVIGSFFGGDGPDLPALAEVGSRALLDVLCERLSERQGESYLRLWWDAGSRAQTGLGVIGTERLFADLHADRAEPFAGFGRPRCAIARCSLHHVREPFLLSVNHWKSGMWTPGARLRPSEDREHSARWLRQYLDEQLNCTCLIVVGDFNTEPYDRCFGRRYLRCERYFKRPRRPVGAGDLYSTAWRFLPAPDYWESTREAGYREPRPKTTFAGWPPVVHDQLMVSRRALDGGPVELREGSVVLHAAPNHAHHTKFGALVPRKWSHDGSVPPVAASDHLPLLATFGITKGAT